MGGLESLIMSHGAFRLGGSQHSSSWTHTHTHTLAHTIVVS